MIEQIDITKIHAASKKINSRKTKPDAGGIKQLAASIDAIGLLHPLVVRKNGKGYELIDGHRRLEAMKQTENKTAPCIVYNVDDQDATEASLAANIMRQGIHPMDQYEAFVALAKQGMNEKEIADHFGTTQKQVKQCLALGTALPELRKLYRQDEINDRTIQKFAAWPVERQREAWQMYKDGNPLWTATASLTEGMIQVNTGLGKWVDTKEYKEHGGVVSTDLFEGIEYYEDGDLAHRLASKHLIEWKAKEEAKGYEVQCAVLGDKVPEYRYMFKEATKDDKPEDCFIIVDQSWAVWPVLVKPEKKPASKDEPAEDKPEISNAQMDRLKNVYTAALADSIANDPSMAIAMFMEKFFNRAWDNPLGIRIESSGYYILDEDDWPDPEWSTRGKIEHYMELDPHTRDLLLAKMLATTLMQCSNTSMLAKLVGPHVPVHKFFTDEAKEEYFKSRKIDWLRDFINEREPNRAGASMKKAQAVEMCVKLCGDWLPDELKPAEAEE